MFSLFGWIFQDRLELIDWFFCDHNALMKCTVLSKFGQWKLGIVVFMMWIEWVDRQWKWRQKAVFLFFSFFFSFVCAWVGGASLFDTCWLTFDLSLFSKLALLIIASQYKFVFGLFIRFKVRFLWKTSGRLWIGVGDTCASYFFLFPGDLWPTSFPRVQVDGTRAIHCWMFSSSSSFWLLSIHTLLTLPQMLFPAHFLGPFPLCWG